MLTFPLRYISSPGGCCSFVLRRWRTMYSRCLKNARSYSATYSFCAEQMLRDRVPISCGKVVCQAETMLLQSSIVVQEFPSSPR